jgi:hypothetical protein
MKENSKHEMRNDRARMEKQVGVHVGEEHQHGRGFFNAEGAELSKGKFRLK